MAVIVLPVSISPIVPTSRSVPSYLKDTYVTWILYFFLLMLGASTQIQSTAKCQDN